MCGVLVVCQNRFTHSCIQHRRLLSAQCAGLAMLGLGHACHVRSNESALRNAFGIHAICHVRHGPSETSIFDSCWSIHVAMSHANCARCAVRATGAGTRTNMSLDTAFRAMLMSRRHAEETWGCGGVSSHEKVSRAPESGGRPSRKCGLCQCPLRSWLVRRV